MLLPTLLLLAGTPAHAGDELEVDFGGMVQYDLRFRLNTRAMQEQYSSFFDPKPELPSISRNELITRFNAHAKMGRFGLKTSLDFVMRGYPQTEQLSDLYLYNTNAPFRFEAQEAYLYAFDLAKGFDLRIGMQKAMFGVGDQFNPTNTVTPNDLEDVLLFGDQQSNLMVRMDYNPTWNVQLTGILVPIFKPALLPRTGFLAQNPERFPYVSDASRWTLNVEKAIADHSIDPDVAGALLRTRYPTVVGDIAVQQPEFRAENMQGFFRAGGQFGLVDVALSYYRGFSDSPQPIRTDVRQTDQPLCPNPEDELLPPEERPPECYDGQIRNDVVLGFPRMHVLGLNLSGEAGIGYRLEFGAFFPDEVRNPVYQDNITFETAVGSISQDGLYDFGDPDGDVVVSNTPFFKWSLGLDYTISKHVYLNTMWIHGFPDEFGAGDWLIGNAKAVRASDTTGPDGWNNCVELNLATFDRTIDGSQCAREWYKPRINDYVVLGLDINFASQRGLLRLFTIWDVIGIYEESWNPTSGEREVIWHHLFTKDGFSAVIYPSLAWNFGNGLEVEGGALLELGKPWSKFGSPEAGGNQLWTRARYSF